MAALLGGAVGFVAGVTVGLVRRTAPRRLIVGNIDLSSVDLSRPFRLNFSVGSQASTDDKSAALQRLRSSMVLFNTQLPAWRCEPMVNVPQGTFILKVTAFDDPAQRVARVLVES